MIEYTVAKLKLSSKYLGFQDWLDKYEEILDIYYQESGCNADETINFEDWARGFYHDCQRWDEYERDD